MFRFLMPLALLLASACEEETLVACTDDLRYAIDLTVVDDSGVPIPEATVTYSVDGGPTEDCNGVDGYHSCGPELAGEYELTIEADGYDVETVVEEVLEDACHVIPAVLEVTLLPTI